jgi:hypothetical protein
MTEKNSRTNNKDKETRLLDKLIAPLSWAQRRDGKPLKRVFKRASIGLIFRFVLYAAVPCVLLPT